MQNPAIRHDLFGFTTTPFVQPPPKPFLDTERQKCLEGLEQFLHYRGFAAVAGKPGNGKTALVRYFTETLHAPSHKIMYLACGQFSDRDLLHAICALLEITPAFRKTTTFGAIRKRLRDLGSVKPLLVIDEMQNAADPTMEALRLLANDQFDRNKTLACIMIGTDAFFDKLGMAINESLRQRVTFFHSLRALDEQACGDYIRHCLDQAGAHQELFEPPALKLIHDLSGGVIRLINTLAAAALAGASTAEKSIVELAYVRQAQQQCLLPTPERRR